MTVGDRRVECVESSGQSVKAKFATKSPPLLVQHSVFNILDIVFTSAMKSCKYQLEVASCFVRWSMLELLGVRHRCDAFVAVVLMYR
jgi:hypothetical protein